MVSGEFVVGNNAHIVCRLSFNTWWLLVVSDIRIIYQCASFHQGI